MELSKLEKDIIKAVLLVAVIVVIIDLFIWRVAP